MTMKIYTDATRLPAAEGIDRLPSLTQSGPQLGPQENVPDWHDLSRFGTLLINSRLPRRTSV
jgi:hypothetical protein